MSYRKIGKDKYKVEVEKTFNGDRFRKVRTVICKKKGSALKAFINSIELELFDEIDREIADPMKLKDYTYEEYVDFFLHNHEVEQKTIEYYEDQLKAKRTLDFFGDKVITKINKSMVNNFFKLLSETISKRTKKPLSQKTIKHYEICLKGLFNSLIDFGIISENPVDVNIKVERDEIKNGFYEPDIITQISQALFENGELDLEVYFNLVIATGMRPSEIRALEWDKIDFVKKTITINEAIVKTKKGYIRKSTKTRDTRVTYIPSQVLFMLKRLKAQDNTGGFVFKSKDGDFIKENTTKDRWERFCNKYGFEYISPYGLRHSSATLLAYNNVPIPNISKHMGHTNQNTTQKYIHATEAGNEQIKEVMEKTIRQKLTVVR